MPASLSIRQVYDEQQIAGMAARASNRNRLTGQEDPPSTSRPYSGLALDDMAVVAAGLGAPVKRRCRLRRTRDRGLYPCSVNPPV